MASNGAQAAYTPENVLAAVVAMRGTEREAKKQAHEYLERFQKSVCWTAGEERSVAAQG